MSKVIKQMQIEALRTTFRDVKDMVVLSVKGLSAVAEGQLRANLRKKNIRLQIVKNTFTRKVFGENGIDIPADSPVWKGNTVIAWGGGSIAELSQAVEAELKAPKTAAQFKDKVTTHKGAITDGSVIKFEDALRMPTPQQAIANLLGAILGPAAALVAALQGPAGGVVGQIKTVSEKTEGEGAVAPAEAAPTAEPAPTT